MEKKTKAVVQDKYGSPGMKHHRVVVHGAAGGVGTAMLELGSLAGRELYGTAFKYNHGLVLSPGAGFPKPSAGCRKKSEVELDGCFGA